MDKAKQYIKYHKDIIEHEAPCSPLYDYRSNENTSAVDDLYNIIDKLRPLRLCEFSTKKCLIKELNKFLPNSKPYHRYLKNNNILNNKIEIWQYNRFLINWLAKAFSNYKSYVFAYNYLAQIINRDMGQIIYKVDIDTTWNMLYYLIRIEKKD